MTRGFVLSQHADVDVELPQGVKKPLRTAVS
jgi:hypothetical protein